MLIPEENRNDVAAQQWLELGGTHQFAAFMSYFESVLTSLLPYLPSETIAAAMDFIAEEERTLGKAEKNSEWNEIANVRNGYFNDVAGMIGELVCAANLFTKYKHISHPQDKFTQHDQKIDIVADNLSVQVKVVRLEGNKLWIDPSWTTGEATHVALVDVTDQELWLVNRETLRKYSGMTMHESELEDITSYYWYNFGLYPRG